MIEDLRAALAFGDPDKVSALIFAGVDIHYHAEHGYDAFIDAVHGRDVLHDPRLIELLTLLIESGVSLNGMSSYGESAVRVLSRLGRFDAVQLLLNAGANPADVAMTKLIQAIVFGSLADVEAVISKGVDLEGRDYWERTPWLVAIQTGDISKAQLLLDHGANANARGRCGQPPLFYAIENGHSSMLRWLIGIGSDLRQTDDFGGSALAEAAQYDNTEAIEILLKAGEDVNQKFDTGTALSYANNREIALMLLQAGANPLELSSEGRRAILGYPPDPDAELLTISVEDFRQFRSPRFGTQNPETMNNPFWEGMIRSGVNAYQAEVQIEGERDYTVHPGPIWCADRFGQSLTFLKDGRIVQIAGEHEDGYDPDFCIYNDVFVHDSDGTVTIYGYPKTVFPPTDFHTATLIGEYIYVVGALGYEGTRHYGETLVYRLDVNTLQIEHLETTGDKPGWIYKHRAILLDAQTIQITDGQVLTITENGEEHSENATTFALNPETLTWSVIAAQAAR